MKTVLVVGATGAQGLAVVRYLSSTGRYHILAQTRSKTIPGAVALAGMANVELVDNGAGKAGGYDMEAFSAAARRADAVFVNTDGFTLGEQAETYWGIRLFELAAGSGVKQFVYSGLDYNYKKSGYDSRYYVGHYEGKAKVQEWMHAQTDTPMAWTIIRSGPYLEDMYEIMKPAATADGFVFHLPLADGAVPFIHVEDFGPYVDWALSNEGEANRMDFGIATAHITGPELAGALERASGRPTAYADIPAAAWVAEAFKNLTPHGADTKIGTRTVKDDNALLMTFGENFTNWWNLYKASAGNKGLVQRDYDLLDRLHPARIRTLDEWFRKTGWKGEEGSILMNSGTQT